MPIILDDDSLYLVLGGPQIDPSVYRTILGGQSTKENEEIKNIEDKEEINEGN